MTRDRLDADTVLGLPDDDLLRAFNQAGVLAAADVHVARALARLAGEDDPLVELASALAVRGQRAGHVLVDLSAARSTVMTTAETDDEAALERLPWPQPGAWCERLARSTLVSAPDGLPPDRPLRLEGSALYLQRYWQDECAVAAELLRRARATPDGADRTRTAALLDRLFPDDPSGRQRAAVQQAVESSLSVVVGGPGTGKTTTVARLLALLYDQSLCGQRAGRHAPAPLVALAAPTGKAAARMAEAVHEEAGRLTIGEAAREWMLALEASTVDRLLGRRPGGSGRSRHDRHNRLPHDVVVVDETSMMSLPLMARLLDATRPAARLVLLGDPEQLASVETGAVLADIVGPAGRAPVGEAGEPGDARPVSPVAKCVTVLAHNYRFRGDLVELAAAARAGDGDAVVKVLRDPPGEGVKWLETDLSSGTGALEPVVALAAPAVTALADACRTGEARLALAALGRFRLLCAHREGPVGASTCNAVLEQWLESSGMVSRQVEGYYAGRPVVVTANDYGLSLWNGDLGVAVNEGGRLVVAFERGASIERFSPSRLTGVQTAFAMTAHRAQGSEFDEVAFVLPAPPARILTRELFYTAVTRARRSVTVVGSEEAVRYAVARPIARASGLSERLWGPGL